MSRASGEDTGLGTRLTIREREKKERSQLLKRYGELDDLSHR